MQLNKLLAIILTLGASNAASLNFDSDVTINKEDQAQLTSLIVNLQQFNEAHELTRGNELVARSDLPILDNILTSLKNSGIANVIIRQVLLNPKLLDLSSNATIFLLKTNLIDYAALFNAIEKSGLVNQILLATLEDPEALPGVLRLTQDLLKKNVIGIYLQVNPPPLEVVERVLGNLGKDIESIFAHLDFSHPNSKPSIDGDSATKQPQQSPEAGLTTGDNKLLDDLFQSLKDSGLVVSIVQYLLTDPELADPSAQFLINILQSGAIPICDIVHILENTGILSRLVHDILSDTNILKAFTELILDRIAKGIIPSTLVENLFGNESTETPTTVSVIPTTLSSTLAPSSQPKVTAAAALSFFKSGNFSSSF